MISTGPTTRYGTLTVFLLFADCGFGPPLQKKKLGQKQNGKMGLCSMMRFCTTLFLSWDRLFPLMPPRPPRPRPCPRPPLPALLLLEASACSVFLPDNRRREAIILVQHAISRAQSREEVLSKMLNDNERVSHIPSPTNCHKKKRRVCQAVGFVCASWSLRTMKRFVGGNCERCVPTKAW